MVATVQTGTLSGVEAVGVAVEVAQTRGLPGFDVVGLPEAALRESRVRVLAALENSGFKRPDRHFIVNLAPADLRKSGASFDLAIAIALLVACDMCAPTELAQTLVLGELSLDGRVRSVRGVLAQLRSARARGLRCAVVPAEDAGWASLVSGLTVRVARHLGEVVSFFEGATSLVSAEAEAGHPAAVSGSRSAAISGDLSEVCGQRIAKRALEVAAAGGHNLLMVGPPGAGKTMLACRLPDILPGPSPEETLEIATIASVAGIELASQVVSRPFRSPHHSCSEAALVGGGHPIRPGEVTLAHGGVLFLDELPEFRRSAIEALRPTMESGLAMIVRARQCVTMPARPLVVAAMNPCPCGYAGDPKRICRCSTEQAQRYRGRVSGPVIDRFDLHVRLPPVAAAALEQAPGETSVTVRARVEAARAIAIARSTEPSDRRAGRDLDDNARRLLLRSIDALGLSLRAYSKVLRVARTIADLAGSDRIATPHVGEAIQYRLLDRDADSALRPPLTAATT
ncbi:MAG TPA: YifB family Mg chelatase-like AAA ATPase [Polyangiales bacterium]